MPKRLLTFFPSTRRQWVGTFILLGTLMFGSWQAAEFTYRAKLREIEEREWKFWSIMSMESESAVIVVDAETGRITGWNKGATLVLGWTPDEVEGSPWAFLVPEEYIADKYGNIEAYLAKATDGATSSNLLGTVKVITNCRVNTKGGERITCRVAVRTIGSGHYFYVVQLDPVGKVHVVTPSIEVPKHPPHPPIEPAPIPMPIPRVDTPKP